MARKMKVVVGVGVAAVVLMAGWGAWRIRPQSTTRTRWEDGRQVPVRQTRTYRLLPPNQWHDSRVVTWNHGVMTQEVVGFGAYEVTDVWEPASAAAPK